MPALPIGYSLGGVYCRTTIVLLKDGSPPVIKIIVFSAAMIPDIVVNIRRLWR